jgi:hypothetical protein
MSRARSRLLQGALDLACSVASVASRLAAFPVARHGNNGGRLHGEAGKAQHLLARHLQTGIKLEAPMVETTHVASRDALTPVFLECGVTLMQVESRPH